MTTESAHVIVGASLAGAQGAQTMREDGFDGPVILIGDENELPYERPGLSKGYLIGTEERAKLDVHRREWYADNDVELRLGEMVTGIDRGAHEIRLAGGERVGYAKLLRTTPSSPPRPHI